MLILILYIRIPDIPAVLLCLILSGFFIRTDINTVPDLKRLHNLDELYTSADRIPEDEKKSAIAIWMSPEIYLNTGIEPCIRYCAYQFVHFPVVPEMLDEFIHELRTRQPKWIIVLKGYEGIYEEAGKILNENYHFEFSDADANFYRIN